VRIAHRREVVGGVPTLEQVQETQQAVERGTVQRHAEEGRRALEPLLARRQRWVHTSALAWTKKARGSGPLERDLSAKGPLRHIGHPIVGRESLEAAF